MVIPVEYAIQTPDTEGSEEIWLEGVITELSANGLSMSITNDIPPETSLLLKFQLPEPVTDLHIRGEIQRVEDQQEDKSQVVAFYPDIPNKLRETIMRYLVNRQRVELRGEQLI